jgi:hypothetical protein
MCPGTHPLHSIAEVSSLWLGSVISCELIAEPLFLKTERNAKYEEQ